MNLFHYRNDRLFGEDVDLIEVANSVGTPCYVYSRATIERHWHVFDQALARQEHLLCYSVKANSNIAVLNILARLGSGFDIVSGGELQRVLRAGGSPGKVVFSGVWKSPEEMRLALEANIYCFNVESIPELEQLNNIAAGMGVVAPIALRINPDIDADTHPYIATGLKENKFGIDINVALKVYRHAVGLPHLDVLGIDCHIGSQLTELGPFVDALQHLCTLVDQLRSSGIDIKHIDLGGGLGINYRDEQPPSPAEYITALVQNIADRDLRVIIEPGRTIVGNAGILLTRVGCLKHTEHKNFAIVDAAMNDLLRPALYGAWQDIIPVILRQGGRQHTYDVVGPVCETGDFLGHDRVLNIQAGDLLAVCSAGAYGFSMSSNYNSRPRVAEVVVDGAGMHVVRRREEIADLMAGESLLPEE